MIIIALLHGNYYYITLNLFCMYITIFYIDLFYSRVQNNAKSNLAQVWNISDLYLISELSPEN